MPKDPFLPRDDAGKCLWITPFAANLPGVADAVGVTPAEVAQTQADKDYFIYACNVADLMSQKSQEWTAYKKGLRQGPAVGAPPVALVLPPAPDPVPADIFGRLGKLCARIKKHSGYTDAIGQTLNIIGAEQTVDVNSMKPVLKITLQASRPNVGWKKQGMDGLEIWVDRGTGTFAFLAIDTVPDYLDTAPLPGFGTGAVWKYKAIYRLKDEQVGQWSDVASVSVMG